MSVAVDRGVVRPGDDLKMHVVVKNGLAPLEARALLPEIEGVEAIDLPRHANMNNVIQDIAASTPQPAQPACSCPNNMTNLAVHSSKVGARKTSLVIRIAQVWHDDPIEEAVLAKLDPQCSARA